MRGGSRLLEIAQLVGLCVIAYFLLVGIVMLFTKSSVEDARKNVSSFFQRSYELSRDENYIKAVNDIVKDILGEVRYVELCTLNKYSNTLQFCDTHDGLPSVKITLSCNDENERKRLETILEGITKQYLLNYKGLINAKVLLEWSQNEIVHLPMMIILYSRNENEYRMLEHYEQSNISKIASKYGDVLDDIDDLL